jgi:hypothetical protein
MRVYEAKHLLRSNHKGHTNMTTHTLTPEQKHTLAHLIVLRYCARNAISAQNINRQTIAILESAHMEAIQCGDTEGEALAKIRMDRAKETGLELKFQIIQVGKDFIAASSLAGIALHSNLGISLDLVRELDQLKVGDLK